MSKLSPADRKEAKQTIQSFYADKMPPTPDVSEICNLEVEKLAKKHHKQLHEISDLRAKLSAAIIKLENKLPANFCLNCNEIEVSYRRNGAVAKSTIDAAKKRRKPFLDQQKALMTKLQTISTREELKVLFQNAGVLG